MNTRIHKRNRAISFDGATYTHDNAGNRTSKLDYLSSVTSGYSYDAIYQLTQVTQAAATTESYSFDGVGNRLSSLGTAPYAYNSSNQLTARPGVSYTYDDNGNRLTETGAAGTTTFTWDFENRLTSVDRPGWAVINSEYDPFGRRIRRSWLTNTIAIYAYDGEDIILEMFDGGKIKAFYTHGPGIDEPLAIKTLGLTHYYHADGLGSVTSLTDWFGAVYESYTYDAFGNVTSTMGTLVNNPYRYTGREWDRVARLYFYRARFYDSAIGRFLNEDPSGFDGGINFYAYVENDPVNFNDPFGFTKLEGFPADKRVEMEVAITRIKLKLSTSCCAGNDSDKLLGLLENATIRYNPNMKECGKAPWGFLRKQILIGPNAFDSWCIGGFRGFPASPACTLLHEVGHLKRRFKFLGEKYSFQLERKCFGCAIPDKYE